LSDELGINAAKSTLEKYRPQIALQENATKPQP
jgi:hypothetical protein